MSWDAWLTDDRGHSEGDWNYTHNCNGMANAALTEDELRDGARRWWLNRGRLDVVATLDAGEHHGSWWMALDGLSGPSGGAWLNRIIRALETEPNRFRAMNPENGWGDFDSFVKVLTEMRDAVPEWPCTWGTGG